MRNRALHDALREFALECASLLTDELRDGAEIEFDVLDEGGGRGPALYRYRPRTAEFVAARWEELRVLPACSRAGVELGAGASLWLRVNGLGGEKAEPALRAMLERLYEDATSFGFPEERFERLYEEVEQTLYQGAQQATIAVPLRGVVVDCERVEFGSGLALARGDRVGLPPEAAWAEGGPVDAVVVLERDTRPGEPIAAAEIEDAAARIVTGMRLLRPGAASLSPVVWQRTGEGRHSAIALAGSAGGGATASRGASGDAWVLTDEDGEELRDLVRILTDDPLRGAPAWALSRFELGCAQPSAAEALSDYLLALRALLDATSDAGEASLALRVAALCAEEGQRRAVQHRIELAVGFERFAMQGGGHLDAELRAESAPELVAELEGYLRALLRDILCGYLDPDLKSVADDILLESREPIEIAARDLRAAAADPAPVAAEPAPVVAAEPPHHDEPIERSERRREWFEEPDERPHEAVRHVDALDEADPRFAEPDDRVEDTDFRFDEPDERFRYAGDDFEEDDRRFEEPDAFVREDADTQEVPVLAVAPPPLDDQEIRAHRGDRYFPPLEAVDAEQQRLEGVTPSADWGFDDPEDFSAPI